MGNKEKWLAWIAKNPIQVYLKRTGISVKAIAAMISVSRASVYFWLSGEKIPSTQRLEVLENAGIATAKDYSRWWAENPTPSNGSRSKSAISKECVRALLEEKSEVDPITGCKVYCGCWTVNGASLIRIGRRTYSVQMAALWVAGKVELYDRVYAYRTCRSPACCNLQHIKVAKDRSDGMKAMHKTGVIKLKTTRGIYLTERRREAVNILLEEGRTVEQIAGDTGVAVHLIKRVARQVEKAVVA